MAELILKPRREKCFLPPAIPGFFRERLISAWGSAARRNGGGAHFKARIPCQSRLLAVFPNPRAVWTFDENEQVDADFSAAE